MNQEMNPNYMLDLRRSSAFDSFTSEDHRIVRQALARLNSKEQTIVRLRFWEKNNVEEIAEIMDLDFSETEALFLRAFAKLKRICLTDPNFSRSFKHVDQVLAA